MPKLRASTVDNRLTNLETKTEATAAQLQALTAAVLQLSGEVTRVNANLQTLTAEFQQNRRNTAPPAPNANPNPKQNQNQNPPPIYPVMNSNSKFGIGSPSINRQENFGVNSDEDKEASGLFAQDVLINLKVKGQDGNETIIKMKRSTQLKKLMVAWCDRHDVTESCGVIFLFRGRRLPGGGEETPDDLGMQDWDEMDAMLQQRGS